MQAAENSARFLGYVLCMKSVVRPSQRFWGKKEHAHFLSGNTGKCFKVPREQDYFLGTWHMKILKIAFREQGNMANYFLGNMVLFTSIYFKYKFNLLSVYSQNIDFDMQLYGVCFTHLFPVSTK